MKLWAKIIVGIVVLLVAFLVLAFAVGWLEYLLGVAIIAAIIGAGVYLWSQRNANLRQAESAADLRLERRQQKQAHQELMRLERSLTADRQKSREASTQAAAMENPQTIRNRRP